MPNSKKIKLREVSAPPVEVELRKVKAKQSRTKCLKRELEVKVSKLKKDKISITHLHFELSRFFIV